MSEPLPEYTDNSVRPEDGPQDDLPQRPNSVFGEDGEDD